MTKAKKFREWIELEIYFAARDWASIRYGVLREVYLKLFGKEPDLKEIERGLKQ